jgi:hypothetical protein
MEVEEKDVTGSTTHRVSLSHVPTNPTEVAVDPIGGPAQVLGVDFVVEGRDLIWDLPTSDIKRIVSQGYRVILRVIYERAN